MGLRALRSRLHYFSTSGRPIRRCRLQKSDRRVDRRGTQVHIALGRPEVLMAGELLDGSHRCSTHRKMRTERVPKNVDARLYVRAPCGSSQHHLDDLLRQRLPFSVAQHSCAAKVTRLSQRISQPSGRRNVPQPAALRHRHVTLPLGSSQLDQQIGANRQVRRLFTREANVPTNVAARWYDHDAAVSGDGVDAVRWLFRRL
jgi:hypothetical protein